MGEEPLGGILFDLDGVLYNSGHLIDGAVEAVAWVQRQQIPHLFVTNTTPRFECSTGEKLTSFGFSVPESAILTPAVAAADWLRAGGSGAIALFVPPSTRSEFAELQCLPDEAEVGASYVIIGDMGERWDYRTLNRAFRLLHHNPEPY